VLNNELGNAINDSNNIPVSLFDKKENKTRNSAHLTSYSLRDFRWHWNKIHPLQGNTFQMWSKLMVFIIRTIYTPVGKIAEKTVCRSVFFAHWDVPQSQYFFRGNFIS